MDNQTLPRSTGHPCPHTHFTGPRHPRLRHLLPAAAAAVFSAAWGTAQVNVAITADNAYSFGYGSVSNIPTTSLFGGVENCNAGAIFNCVGGPETYLNVPAGPDDYLYIIAYSDESSTQGVLGQFVSATNANKKVYTGTSAWQVFATGVDYDPCGSGGPSLAVINQQIVLANAGGGGAGSSGGWVGVAGGGSGTVGALAIGEANDNAGGDFPQVCTSTIDTAATWMWYNPDPSSITNPFRGTVGGEFLIFRLPVQQVVNPRVVKVNKDIENTTGQTATGIDILIKGHPDGINDIFHGTTPNFTVVQQGANTLLRWSGGNIPPNAIRHVGFSLTPPQSVEILGLWMTNNGVQIGCAHQCNSNLHLIGFGGNITYTNSTTACESVPLYVGAISLEYYENEVPLAVLNGTSPRSPIHVDNLPVAPVLLQPGESVNVAVPPPPPTARYVVLAHTVSTSPTLAGPGNTLDWMEVTVDQASGPVLGTLIAGGNGGNAGGGVFFDLTVAAGGVTIDQMDVNLGSAPATTGSIELWVLPGTSHVGRETSSGGWLLVGSGQVTAAGRGLPSPVRFDPPVCLPAGSYGVGLHAVGVAHAYTNGTTSNRNYGNSELSLVAGSATNGWLTTGNVFTPRVANCAVFYNPGAYCSLASAVPYGAGCAGLVQSAERPVLGTTVNLTISGIPAGSNAGVQSLGLVINPGFDLTFLGMPACFLLADPWFPLAFSVAGGSVTVPLAIPSSASLVGATIGAQAVTISPGVNPLGIATSNGVQLTLGSR
ncbi:MAG: hypothetical protein IPM29_31820 [Planctomycetes bacterium]|nr:hypothetical protein [Planctomycetota bacterium]